MNEKRGGCKSACWREVLEETAVPVQVKNEDRVVNFL